MGYRSENLDAVWLVQIDAEESVPSASALDRPIRAASLRAGPDQTAAVAFNLPPRCVVQVSASSCDVDPSGSWCRVLPWELRRFGARTERDMWIFVDGCNVRRVGGIDGRVEPDLVCAPGCHSNHEGQVWFDSAVLPSLEEETAPPCLLRGQGELDCTTSDVLRSLHEKLTDRVLQQLISDGFVVIDEALPTDVCNTLRAEMDVLLEHDQMWESESYSFSEGAAHHDIFETTLDFRDVRKHAPVFSSMEGDLGLMKQLQRLPGLEGLSVQHLRMQINKGNGGCYTMHTDSGESESPDGSVQVLRATALFYLNEGWEEAHGGELRVYPYPLSPVKIPPLNGRLVLFEPRMVHEVLPNFKKRYCFTLWLALSQTSAEASRGATAVDIDSVTNFEVAVAACERQRKSSGRSLAPRLASIPRPLRLLFFPEARPLIVRYVFREYELQSALRSHRDGPQKDEMLKGIQGYHREMHDLNPAWLRALLEKLPAAAAASNVSCNEPRLGPAEFASLVMKFCPWWES